MDVDSNKVTWVVALIAIVSIIGLFFVKGLLLNSLSEVNSDLTSAVSHNTSVSAHTDSYNTLVKADTLTMYKRYMKAFSKKNGSDQMYINTTDSTSSLRSLSESQGYGMVFTTLAGKQSDYDKLLLFFQKHQYSDTGLMAWKINMSSGTAEDNDATDGDLWIAYSLFKAYDRWGDKSYLRAGKTLASDILKYDYNSETKMLTTGNWVTSGSTAYYVVRTSDILPAFFTEINKYADDSRWSEINVSSLKIAQQVSAANDSGLFPDVVIYKDGQTTLPKTSPLDGSSNYYSYNACRVPLNLAMTSDSNYHKVLLKMLDFFAKQSTIYAGYQMDGSVLSSDQYTVQAFTAPIYAGTLIDMSKYGALRDKYPLVLNTSNYYSASQAMGASLIGSY